MRVALVTGASSGIGEALVHTLAKEGWQVVAMARRAERLHELAQTYSNQVMAFPGDVTNQMDCERAVNAALAEWGRLDAVIANAGISMRALVLETDLAVLRTVMEVNFWGAVHTIKAALPAILKAKGWIVGISSIAGYRGLPARSGYSASKFALNGFLEALRTELLPTGVHVLIAAPGFTQSEIREKALTATGQPQNESPLPEHKLMSAQAVAQAIYKAMLAKQRVLVLTKEGRLTRYLNCLLPGLLDKLVYRRFAQEAGSPLAVKP